MGYIAHIKHNIEGEFEIQDLEDHLNGTAELAANFASSFKNEVWGKQLGLWHDLGKLSNEFQEYIRIISGFKEGDNQNKIDHSSVGAIYSNDQLPQMGLPLAYCIAGHHTGLLNWYSEIGISGDMQSRLLKTDLLKKIAALIPDSIKKIEELNLPCEKTLTEEQMHLWIRMLFSCLVDADFLDTERFMNPESFNKRGKYKSIEEIKILFDKYMSALTTTTLNTPINIIRAKILQQCRIKGKDASGFFSITVPTGGGKTLSSMAWALEHAIKYEKKRIIVVIPYTSIITQTAQVFRDIFGEKNVVEHHSNIDEEADIQERKLAIENWDAPIIVTTNVQFFESLFANKTSRCRKLHNIANSIVILDEAQMLPPEFLKPILIVLKGLVENFCVTALFSTATQPALTGKIGSGLPAFIGIEEKLINEIIPDSCQLQTELKRVNVNMPLNANEASSWADIAFELQSYDQVLCIVNTRRECHELYKLMPTDTIHLSRMMCSAHIMNTIKTIKDKLKEGKPVRVVSTQLLEAGVDIDFPVVYRVLAGLDSIAQSAGRCNREGKLNKEGNFGITKVFCTEKGTPPGLMRKGADTMKELLHLNSEKEFLSPAIFQKYFELFYSKVLDFDKPKIYNLLCEDALRMKFQFATAANNFKLIDDKGSQSIIVLYKEGANLAELLKRKGPEPWIMRKLQQYIVSVNPRDFEEIKSTHRIEEFHGCWIQTDAWLYNSIAGLMYGDEWLDEILIK